MQPWQKHVCFSRDFPKTLSQSHTISHTKSPTQVDQDLPSEGKKGSCTDTCKASLFLLTIDIHKGINGSLGTLFVILIVRHLPK